MFDFLKKLFGKTSSEVAVKSVKAQAKVGATGAKIKMKKAAAKARAAAKPKA